MQRIGLALSGGGFRATLFHIGVIKFLREQGVLENVQHICSVSGGSITAAHLVLNWERYNGNDQEFSEAVEELTRFTKTDLRGFVVRPWLFSYAALGVPRIVSPQKWTRPKLCEAQYDRFFRKARLSDLKREGRPELHLLATSLTTGKLVSFNNSGVAIENEQHLDEISASNASVAMGVAASSAFPPLFTPVLMNAHTLGLSDSVTCEEQYLTDGGVFDNLGLRKLLWLHNKSEAVDFDLVVASRAERDNPEDHGNPYPFVWQRASRSTDLMMQRISWFERDSISRLEREAHCEVVLCDLTKKLNRSTPAALPEDVQAKVQTIRTDLDTFSDSEVSGLIRHAHSVLDSEWPARLRSSEIEGAEGSVQSISPSQLAKSHRTKLGLFSIRDWSSWATLCLVLAYIAIPSITFWVQSQRMRQAEADARKLQDALEKQENDRARQQKRIDVSVQLVENLAALLASNSVQEYHKALEEWKAERDELLDEASTDHEFFRSIFSDGFFKNSEGKLLELEVWIKKELKKGGTVVSALSTSNFPVHVLRLAHAIRDNLLDENSPDAKEYELLLKDVREDLFAEDKKVVDEIIDWASGEGAVSSATRPEDVKVSRERFRELYWGVLGLVEGRRVASAMRGFEYAFQEWEDRFKGQSGASELDVSTEIAAMKAARDVLFDALDSELGLIQREEKAE